MKIVIIGAGSVYTPELLDGLFEFRRELPVNEIVLVDINVDKLQIMLAFCRRYADHIGLNVNIWATKERKEALPGAVFVNTQLRVGGNAARSMDEKIPMKYGVIGQETTGPGGMMKALRTLPVMVDIARDVCELCPDAWIINYTNPTGMVAEAVIQETGARIAGLCAGGFFPRDWTAKAMGVDPTAVRYNYFGLNHMNFANRVTVHGRAVTEEEMDRIIECNISVDPRIGKATRLLMSPYLQYYYHTADRVARNISGSSRGEQVMELEAEIYRCYEDKMQVVKPSALAKRGGGGYSAVAMQVMSAIRNNHSTWVVANVPNQGVLPFLPYDAVIETPCIADARGMTPLAQPDCPRSVRGLISSVKTYEQLSVSAALSGSRDIALQALLAHPLVMDYSIAAPMLDEMLEANRIFLPRFFDVH